MAIETVRAHGQVTIPEKIRRQLRLGTGARLRFEVDAEGGIRLVPVADEEASGQNSEVATKPGRVTEDATRAWSEERRFIKELIAKGPVPGGPRWTRENLHNR